MLTIRELVKSFSRRKNQSALIVDGESISYQKFHLDIIKVTDFLGSKNITTHSKIVIDEKNKYEYLVSVYAIMNYGAIAIPIGDESEIEKKKLIDFVDPQLILCKNPVDSNEYSTRFVLEKYFSVEKKNVQLLPVSEDLTALILFTSGTTGDRKATKLSHLNLMRTTDYINEFMNVAERLVEYICIPLSHSFGFGRTRCILRTGGTMILDHGMFNPRSAIDRIRKYKANAISGVPAVMAMFRRFAREKVKQINEQIKYIEIGSAPMPKNHKEYLISCFSNANICMHYGLTEASRSCFINFKKEYNKLDTVGKPSPSVAIKIVDEKKNELETSKIGEIAISGGNVAKGYYKNDALTKQKFSKEWFYSGDSGYKDDEGYVHFKGRMDDLINVGGKKISAMELEEKVNETDTKPRDYCIVGIPDIDGILGEVPTLCTTDENYNDRKFAQLVDELLSLGLKRNFLPRSFKKVSSLPKTQSGKVIRSELRQYFI